MLATALSFVGQQYPQATGEDFTGHHVASYVRGELANAIRDALGTKSSSYIVKGSAGQSTWAAVPWASIFDPLVTSGAQTGYYVVYLFASDGKRVFLSLNQGATAVEREFGRGRRDSVLRDRAALMRARLPEFLEGFDLPAIDLASTANLPLGYMAGHALGKAYEITSLPSEADLRSDLEHILHAYSALTFRGGLEPSPEAGALDEDVPPGSSVIETRQYKFHRRIDRHPQASRMAKQHHGTRCQGCGLSFGERYGTLGEGFIEAHHLKPLSSLKEGETFQYDVKKDFAVLCSNCHRMIHRTSDSSDLEAFKKLLVTA
ncbi:DUF3578 domain-containing protein [Nitratireductor mangrovi]|uniref:DUF3578 domain-containing protein n=1 Tax=Nitratireductor mangrovi TaxID=2599600 RepID=A0A5B8KV85_9HYPH|nr:DUF3578 domain-containing protein [Nitratireductor mangrovi]QDY99495.1 DUF3578 domain-containing protein [Nitratireductor mangrovi]